MTIDLEQIERLKASAVEQKIGPKRLPGTAGRWAERLREAAWKVGLHGTVTLTLPSYQAMNLADKIDMAEDRFQVKRDLEETIEGAKEMLRDEYMRYAQATCDLELLLMNFIGRPPMSMDEVREQQRQFDARDPSRLSAKASRLSAPSFSDRSCSDGSEPRASLAKRGSAVLAKGRSSPNEKGRRSNEGPAARLGRFL